MEKELHFPPPIEPLAMYEIAHVHAITGAGERTIERWPLPWFYLGTKTRRVFGIDLIRHFAKLRERDTGLSPEDLEALAA